MSRHDADNVGVTDKIELGSAKGGLAVPGRTTGRARGRVARAARALRCVVRGWDEVDQCRGLLTDVDGTVPVGADAHVGGRTRAYVDVVVDGAIARLSEQEDRFTAVVDDGQGLRMCSRSH